MRTRIYQILQIQNAPLGEWVIRYAFGGIRTENEKWCFAWASERYFEQPCVLDLSDRPPSASLLRDDGGGDIEQLI